MKAVYKSRTPIVSRVDLGKAAPLSTPLTLLIEPVSLCNLKCTFCPTGDVNLTKSTGKFRGFIDFDVYKKIIDDTKAFDSPIKMLHLQKDGEPLLHPRFIDLVDYAKNAGIERVETTTNGIALSEELNEQLTQSKLDRLKISIYGLTTEEYKLNSGVSIDFQKLVKNIKDLYYKKRNFTMYIKTMEEGLPIGGREKFLEIFGNICDEIYFEHCVDNWPDFKSDNVVPIMDQRINILGAKTTPFKKVCPQPFYNLTVCADGEVTGCCADWAVKLKMGNVNNQSLLDIWNGQNFLEFRMMMLRGERSSHPICGNCGYPTFTCVDDMDDDAKDVLSRISI